VPETTRQCDPGPLTLPPAAFESHQRFLEAQARAIRRWIVAMSGHARTGHVGSSLCVVDVLTALYFHALRVDALQPDLAGRDRLILSKGHAASALYATLAARGFLPHDTLWEYLTQGSELAGHVVAAVPGIEWSTGSLGHGLPVGVGMAMAARRAAATWRTFIVMSDGECDEGSVWEAALAAGALHLDNLVAIIDCNHLQALGRTRDVLPMEPFAAKWRGFNWSVSDIDGHDMHALTATLDALPIEAGKPSVILARTVGGKGVSFMEDRIEWHYLTPTIAQVTQALEELR
jgi:transketolase